MASQEVIRIGKCIYCGAINGKLSAEHAIPYGLSGNLVLHDASCGDCARITSAFEMHCLRGLLAKARARLNLKSRRPKPVATVFKIDHGFGWEQSAQDAKQFAGITPLPVFEPPAFLRGQRADEQIRIRALDPLDLGNPLPSLPSANTRGNVTVEFTIDMDVWAFARMLAKIGYCCAVAHLSLRRIGEVYVLPSILGQSNDVQTWVGSEDILFNRPANLLHQVEVFVSSGVVFARVCLFAAFGGNPYTVVVGKFRDETSGSLTG